MRLLHKFKKNDGNDTTIETMEEKKIQKISSFLSLYRVIVSVLVAT